MGPRARPRGGAGGPPPPPPPPETEIKVSTGIFEIKEEPPLLHWSDIMARGKKSLTLLLSAFET